MKRLETIRSNTWFLGGILIFLSFSIGCNGGGKKLSNWKYHQKDVVTPKFNIPKSIEIDIYLDATMSMIGYTSNSSSNYNKFLEELETTETVAWPNSHVRFFKFGTRIKEITKDQFRDARSQNFYTESGICETTNIDLVINKTDSSRVSVVITDLFQDEGNLNAIVEQIKQRCFMQGIQVAILGIRSDFNGMVYDAGPQAGSYPLRIPPDDAANYRPFYAFIFGDPINIQFLFNNLKQKSFVDEENFLVLSRYIINDYKISSLVKTRECRTLGNLARRKKELNHFRFKMRKGEDNGKLVAKMKINRNVFTPDFNEANLKLVAFRKLIERKKNSLQTDSVRTTDISLEKIERQGNQLDLSLDLNLDDEPGRYTYQVHLASSVINGLKIPDWVSEFSSDAPSPKKDAWKTLNLYKFVNSLVRANLSIYQPKVTKFYITIEKL